MPHGLGSPRGGFVRVAGRARVGDLIFVGHRRRDERERVRAHVDVRDRRFNFRHMARHTYTP